MQIDKSGAGGVPRGRASEAGKIRSMTNKILIVGGGIGGLAAALACARAGLEIELFERGSEFTEVGAGIQMGPNVTKILHAWGLSSALAEVAAFPQRLQVCSATTGAQLGMLRLGEETLRRYGAPYATIHRADLQQILLKEVSSQDRVLLNLGSEAKSFVRHDHHVALSLADGRTTQGEALVGADGLWSRVRQQMLQGETLHAFGHLAYRALVPQSALPERLRSQQITVWLGPRLHVVQYPVRGGEWLNVVAIVQGRMHGDAQDWNHDGNAQRLQLNMAATCHALRDLTSAIESWRLWSLNIRPPMRGAFEQAQGRVALLGDAAHPMLPYLAQGAGMAIEDANELARALQANGANLPAAMQQYAQRRWQRNARVQSGALRNAQIFHAQGLLRWGRDLAMRVVGERLLDMPWLYRGAL